MRETDIHKVTQDQQVSVRVAAYPDLKTIDAGTSIEEAFARAIRTAEGLGWEIYHQDLDAGIIEAVDTTRIMAFKDDIVIRVRSNAQGAYVDLRSVSRDGRGDIGVQFLNWSAQRSAFDSRVTSATSDSELFDIFSQMLAPLGVSAGDERG